MSALQRTIRTGAVLISVLVLAPNIHARSRSFVGVTSWPSFRLGTDLGRFEWYVDLQWYSWASQWDERDSSYKSADLTLSPSVGGNVTLYDSLLVAYVGGLLGTDLRFYNGEYSDEVDINVALGGGVEWRFHDKVSLVAEYLLGFSMTFYPDIGDRTNFFGYGFHNLPSVQFRYYIGPPVVRDY